MDTKVSETEAPRVAIAISGSVNRAAFASRLRLLKKHMERHWTIPILNYVTIEFDAGGTNMKLAHYGLDMAMEADIAATGAGVACVPMQSLLAFVAAADGETIGIEKKPEEPAVTFRCAGYSIELFPLPVEDVPRLDLPDAFARTVAMGEGVLSYLLAMTMPFISSEETRYYLNGICFEIDENTLRAVATDGHRLGTRQTTAPAPVEAWTYHPIVPRAAVAAAAGLVSKAQCTLSFHAYYSPEGERHYQSSTGPAVATVPAQWVPKCARFSCDDWTITTKLIDGTFPQWRRVVPDNRPDEIVNASLKVADITRFGAMARGLARSLAVKLEHRSADNAALTIRQPDGGKLTGEIEANVNGEFQTFGVNVYYLAAIAKAFGAKWINLQIKYANDPVLITGEDSPEGEFAVLMPMRV